MNWHGRTATLGVEPVFVPLRPPQIPHTLAARNWNMIESAAAAIT